MANYRTKEMYGIYYNKITEQKARHRVNEILAKISTHNKHTYYERIPWGSIMDAVTSVGFEGALITNINDNKDGKAHVHVGGSTYLWVSWHKFPTGRYEVIAYVS